MNLSNLTENAKIDLEILSGSDPIITEVKQVKRGLSTYDELISAFEEILVERNLDFAKKKYDFEIIYYERLFGKASMKHSYKFHCKTSKLMEEFRLKHAPKCIPMRINFFIKSKNKHDIYTQTESFYLLIA